MRGESGEGTRARTKVRTRARLDLTGRVMQVRCYDRARHEYVCQGWRLCGGGGGGRGSSVHTGDRIPRLGAAKMLQSRFRVMCVRAWCVAAQPAAAVRGTRSA